MKLQKKRAYAIAGYNITLEEIVQNSKIEVIKGTTKKLHLKMGENTGITDAEKMSDTLNCFIPDADSCQYLVMSEFMDVFNLKPHKILIGMIEKAECFDLGEADIEQFITDATENRTENKKSLVYEYCFEFDPTGFKEKIDHENETRPESKYQTHLMIEGLNIPLNEIPLKTPITIIHSKDNTLCLKLGENIGITNVSESNHTLNYVTSEGENDLTEMAKELSDALKLELVKIHAPIIASPDEFQIDEKFFQLYGKVAIDQIGIEKAILLLTTCFQKCEDPEYIPIPIELFSDDPENNSVDH